MANENAVQKEQDSLDAIMNDIKDVITDKKQAANTDVLELTEVVKEVAKEAIEEKKAMQEPDILEKIDSGVSNTTISQEALLSEKVANDTKKSLEQFTKLTTKSNVETLKFRSGGTVEDIIVELLKPQLSEWLNKNLSSIVTQVVEREIKKLIPKE